MTKLNSASFQVTREEYIRRLDELRATIDESVSILSWEPAGSMEGRRCDVARDYGKRLEENYQKAVKANAAGTEMEMRKKKANRR
jgi:hypothetical protein